jgi:hypothetical protein
VAIGPRSADPTVTARTATIAASAAALALAGQASAGRAAASEDQDLVVADLGLLPDSGHGAVVRRVIETKIDAKAIVRIDAAMTARASAPIAKTPMPSSVKLDRFAR